MAQGIGWKARHGRALVAAVAVAVGLAGVPWAPAGADVPTPKLAVTGGEVAWAFDPAAYFSGAYGTITPIGGATAGTGGQAVLPIAAGTVDPVTGAARLELTGGLSFTSALYGVTGATVDDVVVVLPAEGEGWVEADRTGPTASSATVRTTVALLTTSAVTPAIAGGTVTWAGVPANGTGGNTGALQAGAGALGPLTATIEHGDDVAGAIAEGGATWNVRESLQRYVGGATATPPATGAPSAPGSATQTFTFPAVEGGFFDAETGSTYLPLAGAVVFDHGSHCFRMTITDPAIVISPTDAGIYGHIETYVYPDCPATLPGSQTVEGEGRIFSLGLDGIAPTVAGGVTTWTGIPVTLTDVGAPFFDGHYAAGEPFDPISFSYAGDGGLPVQPEEELTAPGTPVYAEVAASPDLGRTQMMPLVDPVGDDVFGWADNTTLTDLDPATLAVDSTTTFGSTHQYVTVSPVTGRIFKATQGGGGKPWILDRNQGGTYSRYDLDQQATQRNVGAANGTIYGHNASNPTTFTAVVPGPAAATAPLDPASYTSTAWTSAIRAADSLVADDDGTIVTPLANGSGVVTVDLVAGGPTTGVVRTVPGTAGAGFVAMGRSGTIYAGSGTTIWTLAEGPDGYVVDGEPLVLELGIRGYGIGDAADGTIFAVHRNAVSVIRDGAIVSTFPLAANASANDPIDVAEDGTVYIAAGNRIHGFAVTATSPGLTAVAPAEVALGVGQASAPATFTTTVTGDPAPAVQWQRRQAGTAAWTDVEGATGSTLTLDAGARDDATEVRARATNEAGTYATAPVLLTVKAAPSVLRHPDPLSLVEGDSGTLSVDVAGNPQPTVRWQRRLGGFWVDIAGATGASLAIEDANLDQDGTLLRAVVANEVATVTSRTAVLSVAERSTDPAYVVGGELDWGIRQSFRTYITGPIAHGRIDVEDGATAEEGGTYGFPATGGTVLDDALEADFGGAVHFTGHVGMGTPAGVPALDMRLSDVRIDLDGATGRVVADVVSRGLSSGSLVTYDDVHFADLDLAGVSPGPTEDGVTYTAVPATLTEDGVPAFADFYEAGSALDPLTFTLELSDEPPASRTAVESFATAALTDFLGAEPTGQQVAGAVATIGARGRAAYLRELSTSDAWLAGVVNDLYQDTLGRDGDVDGVAFWTGRLRGGWTVARVAASFYASAEYYDGLGGGTDRTWVADLYEAVLLRTATTADLDYWAGETAARGRGDVALRIYQSPESAGTRVTGLYDALLGRAPSAADRTYWSGVVVTRGDLTLAVNLAASAEYQARAVARFP